MKYTDFSDALSIAEPADDSDGGVKVAFNVTALLGMLKVHGLLEQEIPV
jgi:hypothetical protein